MYVMVIYCRNCKRAFFAKNALFCSTRCYEFYTNALDTNPVKSREDDVNSAVPTNDIPILNHVKTLCDHEYSKNGTMSCRKCGSISIVINQNKR